MVVIPNNSGPSVLSSGATNEIIKYVRNNINQTEYEYESNKVKSRSKKVFLTFKDADSWKATLDRRADQKSRGFFARCDRKYRECGEVESKTKQLLIKSLENIGNRFNDQNHSLKRSLSLERHDTKYPVEDQGSNSQLKDEEKRLTIQKDADNGISSIKKLLEKADRRIVSVKAGQPLSAYLQKEMETKKLELLENENLNNSLDMVLIDPSEKQSPGRKTLLVENHGVDIAESQQPAECRKKIDFLEKMDNLIMLFTMVNNMRVRDVRTKVPLSIESLKTLKKHPLVVEATHLPNLRCYDQPQPSTARFGRNSVMVPLGGSLLCHKDTERSNNMGNRLLLPTALNESLSRHSELSSPFNTQRKLRNIQRHKNSPISTPNGTKVETWDELMMIDAGNTGRADSTSLEIDHSARGVSRISIHAQTKFTHKRRGAPWQVKTLNEAVPPWLKILQDQRDNNEKDIQCTRQKGSELKSKKHDEILDNLKSGFETTKQSYAKKMQDELDNRVDAYEKQFELLECNHIRETDMKVMRTKIHEWRLHVNTSMARPPLWIESLKQEQKQLKLVNDEKCSQQLQNIMKFIETKPSLSIKAKLCLMVFSLPAYELCTIQMKEAIKFFIEEVLEQSDNCLKQWLQVRKLMPLK